MDAAHKDLAVQVPTFEKSAGTGTPEQRLREQDQDGIEAEVLFSQNNNVLRQAKEDDLYSDLVRAYNEFLAEEYMAAAPDRLFPMGLIPTTGVDDAVRELERCATPRPRPESGACFPAPKPAAERRACAQIRLSSPAPTPAPEPQSLWDECQREIFCL